MPCITDLLNDAAVNVPDRIAYTFLNNEDEELNITYGELNEESKRIASLLCESCKPGDRVVLSFHSGLDFIKAFYGCLFAGIIAVPFLPIGSQRSYQRLDSVMKDSGASAILSGPSVPLARNNLPSLNGYRFIYTDGKPKAERPSFSAGICHHDIAFLQYTSGSTGAPKGVMVSHENLMENIGLISKAFAQTRHSTIVSWLPHYHDMGLVGTILVPLFNQSRSVLLSPLRFMRTPLSWLKAIDKYRARTSGSPNFGYEACIKAVSDPELAGMDLSCWEIAFVGSEPVRAQTLERFSNKFSKAGFNSKALQPCYGMAEATLLISAAEPGKAVTVSKAISHLAASPAVSFTEVVSCGTPTGFEIVIVNETNDVLDEGHTGEILVKGPAIASGYWNQPQLTESIFKVVLENRSGFYMRTGDIGFINNKELYVSGRKKDMIIFNGRNIYLQDIEFMVTGSIPQLVKNSCACLISNDTDKENLVIISEVEHAGTETLHEQVHNLVLSEFKIVPFRIIFIRKGTLPKTSSGKIQKHVCYDNLINGQLHIINDHAATQSLNRLNPSQPA